jgi:hypothetical protein
MSKVVSRRWVGRLFSWGAAGPICVGLLSSCVDEDLVSDEGTASGGAEAEEGSGGRSPASGGTASGSGGRSAGTGGTASGGAGGAGGANLGGSAPMTEAEWNAAMAPIAGPHEIWTFDTCDEPHSGSASLRVGPEYSVVPSLGYTQAANFDPDTNVVFDVVPLPFCTDAADCSEQPGGACQGVIADAYCQYAEPLPSEQCETDADCTAKAEGECVPAMGYDEARLCYPTGLCEDVTGTCAYAGDLPCTDDADCTERVDGKCILPVVDTHCRYGTCTDDADCGEAERCGCGLCVSAACDSDAACPNEETCELSVSACTNAGGFHCTTPEDECIAGEPVCFYQWQPDGGFWGSDVCLTR